jgi:hypothetical protein
VSSQEVAVRDVALTSLSLLTTTAVCVALYPDVAIRVHALVRESGRSAGSASSLGYYRDFYVLPAALSFVIVSGAGIALAARRGRRVVRIVAAAAWIALLAGIVGSVEWYFSAVRGASGLR